MDFETLWLAGALVLTLLGLAGLVLPLLPGAPLLLAGLVLAAWAEDFRFVGLPVLVLLTGVALLTYAVDFLAGALGAKRYGASPRAIAGAAIGALLGLAAGLPGVLLGPFVGAAVAEFTARRDVANAGRVGVGATLGLLLGAVAKLALGFVMLGIYAVARFV